MSIITETLYIEATTSLTTKLARIDAIILALENRILNFSETSAEKQGYSLDDGQVKISTQYRSVTEMAAAIERFEFQRQRIINKLNGSNITLRPWRGLI
jgi:hypothetical protein